MADAATLEECLGRPGSVGPTSVINNDEKVTLVLDQALLNLDKIHSHPLDNTCSVVLTPTALQEYLSKAGANVVVVDFASEAAPATSGGEPAKDGWTATAEKGSQ